MIGTPFILYDLRAGISIFSVKFQSPVALSHKIVWFVVPLSISPPPLASVSDAAPALGTANSIVLSDNVNVSAAINVVAPSTVRFPLTTNSPPTVVKLVRLFGAIKTWSWPISLGTMFIIVKLLLFLLTEIKTRLLTAVLER